MPKPTTRKGYTPAQVEQVRATCLYVATFLGDLRDDLVVIGGYAGPGIMPSPAAGTPLPSQLSASSTPHHPGSKSEAMSASGALNRPRRSDGGSTASTASSFSVGSTRR